MLIYKSNLCFSKNDRVCGYLLSSCDVIGGGGGGRGTYGGRNVFQSAEYEIEGEDQQVYVKTALKVLPNCLVFSSEFLKHYKCQYYEASYFCARRDELLL